MNSLNLKKGFTLIEILVVIAIISILLTILFANFGQAKEDAKNKAMQAELKEVQLALELYKAQNGKYPPANSNCDTSAFGIFTAKSQSCEPTHLFIDELVPEFIADLPSHTKSANGTCNISYTVDTAGAWYKLVAIQCHAGAANQSEGVQSEDELARCPSVCTSTFNCVPTDQEFYESYAVYSAGGECY